MSLDDLLKKLPELDMPGWAEEEFLALCRKHLNSVNGLSLSPAEWREIRDPDGGNFVNYSDLPVPGAQRIGKDIDRLAVCKLNGGLGTSMGCPGPKSLIPVKGGKTFLDLIVDQLCADMRQYSTTIPLLLMNSFYTEAQTAQALEAYRHQLPVQAFSQNKFPRIATNTLLPLSEARYGIEAWYPPGHGDFYWCLDKLCILDELIGRGKEVLFVSNIDNLGATVDPRILAYMLENDVPFLMEVTEKTPADVKGGSLVWDGKRLRLLEVARVPDDRRDEFYRSEKFRIFNTNNIWIHLRHLRRRLAEGPLDLDVIANRKIIGDQEVLQLETAIGSALEHFPGAFALNVGRERFRPVKKTDDLLLIQSNLFNEKNGKLYLNPNRRMTRLPHIVLGESFARMEDYNKRFASIPDLLELDSLTLDGDVRFEEHVVLKGNVSIHSAKPYTVGKGACLENFILEG